MTEHEKWQLWNTLDDLLDSYREEIACVKYNGWYRRRDPNDIRFDIDTHIKFILELSDD